MIQKQQPKISSCILNYSQKQKESKNVLEITHNLEINPVYKRML